MSKLEISAVAVDRDEDGFWLHPGVPWDEIPEETDCTPYFKTWGYDVSYGFMFDEAPEAVVDQYDEANSADCSYWTPEPPALNDEWFLVAIYDTEDGPCAAWAKPSQQAQGSTDERALLITRARKQRADIQQIFDDANHWNHTHPIEEPINPDPDGQLKRIAKGLDQMLTPIPEAST